MFDYERRRKPRRFQSRIYPTMFKATILATLLASASAFAPTNFAGMWRNVIGVVTLPSFFGSA